VLFINPPYQRRKDSGVNIPLGLGYLSSFIRLKGFAPQILDCAPFFSSLDSDSLGRMENWLMGKLREISPSLAVGVGPCTLASVKSIIAIEKVCKRALPNVPIVYGGPLASIPGLEWFFFEYLDAYAVIPGDGEIVLADLLTELRSGKKRQVEGVSYASTQKFAPNFVKDLEMLPFPARDLFDGSLYFLSTRRDLFVSPFACVVCSRGCPHSCGFCSASVIRNGLQSKRSLRSISEEIQMLTFDMGIRCIVFYDDCSFSNASTANEEMTEFSNTMRAVGKGVVWQIEMRPDIANSLDESSIKAMYESGCRQINLGIEKGTLKGLRSIEKALQPEQSVEACKRIRSTAPNLRLAGTFILGGPGETYEEAVETIEYSKNLGLLFAHFYPLEIYPGTRLYQRKFGSDMRAWLDLILRDTVFAGSIVYEDLLGKEDIAELTCKAYRAFYRRKEWINLGKKSLGSHFETVRTTAFSWGDNPRW